MSVSNVVDLDKKEFEKLIKHKNSFFLTGSSIFFPGTEE